MYELKKYKALKCMQKRILSQQNSVSMVNRNRQFSFNLDYWHNNNVPPTIGGHFAEQTVATTDRWGDLPAHTWTYHINNNTCEQWKL